MKALTLTAATFLLMTSLLIPGRKPASVANYDARFIEISSVKFNEDQFHVIYMKRDSNRVRAKYFATADFNGNNVYQRYTKWVPGRNVILVSSGTYMDYEGVPVGLTIDNGIVVNKAVAKKFDGLVIVNVNGGIAVTNLKTGDLKLKGEGVDTTRKYDLRNNAWDLQAFIKWAQAHEATVFQSHLLVYKNKLDVAFLNASPAVAPRRFLAIGKEPGGRVVHAIIQTAAYATLYDGSKKALDFLNKYKNMEVTCMINLDTGDQDVFKLYDKDGSSNRMIKGEKDLPAAVNLLTYYFQ